MRREGQAIVYRSAVDAWLYVVLGLAALLATAASVTAFVTGDAAARAIAAVALVVGVGLPLWILGTTDYTIDGDELRIRSGPFRTRLRISAIGAITPTRNPLSSPALSLARLRIDYDRSRSVMISPADRAGFLAAIEARRGNHRGL